MIQFQLNFVLVFQNNITNYVLAFVPPQVQGSLLKLTVLRSKITRDVMSLGNLKWITLLRISFETRKLITQSVMISPRQA